LNLKVLKILRASRIVRTSITYSCIKRSRFEFYCYLSYYFCWFKFIKILMIKLKEFKEFYLIYHIEIVDNRDEANFLFLFCFLRGNSKTISSNNKFIFQNSSHLKFEFWFFVLFTIRHNIFYLLSLFIYLKGLCFY